MKIIQRKELSEPADTHNFLVQIERDGRIKSAVVSRHKDGRALPDHVKRECFRRALELATAP